MLPERILAKDKSEYRLAPEGEYRAVCVDAIDLGLVENPKFNVWQHKIALVFQLEARDPDTRKHYEVASRFTLSMNKKATLRGFLTQWRGKSYSEEQARTGIDITALVGQSGIVTIEHQPSGDRTYANIIAIRKLDKDAKPVVADQYARAEYWSKKKDGTPQPSGTRTPVHTEAGPGLAGQSEAREDENGVPAELKDDDDSDLPF